MSIANTGSPSPTSHLFNPLFAQPEGSPIRELFPYLSRPGMLSLAGGYPSPGLFDAEGLQQAATTALQQDAAASLQYGASEGQLPLREALAELCASRGITCTPGDLLVTTGSQQAFDLLVKVMVAPGDPVLVEVPAYPATLQTLKLAQAQVVSVPTDEHGLDTEALARLLAQWPHARRPKLLYTVPNFSNPGGTLLPASRRAALVALAREHGFAIVEDDPYGELRFDDRCEPSVYETGLAQCGSANPVVYLSSLSKTVAPALRIGWMLADAQLLRRCAIAKQTADLCTSPLAQNIAAHYLRSGRYAPQLQKSCAEYAARMDALCSGLEAALGEQIRFVRPAGGMFIWAQLQPQEGDHEALSRALFAAAVTQGVLYVPGKAFFPADAAKQAGLCMRLSYAAPTVPQINEAVERLGRAWQQAVLSPIA
ncbi:PLP-dependent aminotransferase family protein [Acidovorax cavernicola]|uniref:PLP-dependent aminotransferase family protein n=1 Tax=Acidovorax cavernicola TaxID=1675792 RepID=A0A9X8D0G0_9BURK|nr:PLP-dependent aminotransferase family protein [Acidovorax cavernicola]RIX74832.1 PLP-dependent aminotransferase family protein [Acidovorax cavernicola]